MRSIRLSFGDTAVINDLDLDAGPGEIICLLGPSGCGKTTTLRVLAGLERPDSGSVEIDGQVVCDQTVEVAPESRHIGYLFQDYALFPHLTVAQNVGFGIEGQANAAHEVRALLDRVQMGRFAQAMPHTLSGGQQQRVALARALARKPKLLLLDEPFSGLDTALKIQLRESTHSLLKEIGTSAVIVTHDAEEAMFMADRIALMRDGRIVQLGTPAELYNQPVDEFTARFLGEVIELPGQSNGTLTATVAGDFSSNKPQPTGSVSVLVRPEDLELTSEDGPYVIGHRHFIGSHTLVDLLGQDANLPDIQLSVPTAQANRLQWGQRVCPKSRRHQPLLIIK
ncbi:ABC transporter ATP-binding protein [Orrella daihaiensis]|uniref:ABC transporter ATP-binding protein n=1 Tax=Orrella daihaiensis TaxID=2782176 RepID=A0ABY4AL64_9BURK|nr:ABC transporter ATP-binding protein [Orrella daihaiensis]UOD51012.1 ABC transporter ATP-binding protein [Orrella daihaiensis]